MKALLVGLVVLGVFFGLLFYAPWLLLGVVGVPIALFGSRALGTLILDELKDWMDRGYE
jgi:4-hydroxybenzoate polyprenyltransferase